LEARLGAALGAPRNSGGPTAPESTAAEDEGESVAPVSEGGATENGAENVGSFDSAQDRRRPTLPEGEGAPNAWPDESAESAMLSELRERGEKTVALAATEAIEDVDPKNLPALSELVNRLSPEVRETLGDLFRARFVTVRRLPAKALTKIVS
jgi:hypothetical protein